MIYKQKITVQQTTNTVELYVASCLKCGSDEIEISEYEDRYGYISTAKCKNKLCKNESKINESEFSVIKKWNKENDIPTMIEDKTALILQTKTEIAELKVIQRKRKTKRKLL